MSNTGFQITGTVINVAGGNVDWVDPTNAQVLDGSYATSVLTALQTTDLLRCTNFDFSRLDSSDIVVGITTVINAGLTAGSNGDAFFSVVQFWDGSATEGDDQATGGAGSSDDLNVAFARFVYGGPSDLSGAAPTITELQSSGWGVQIQCVDLNAATVAIDAVYIAIHVLNKGTVEMSRARSTIRSRG